MPPGGPGPHQGVAAGVVGGLVGRVRVDLDLVAKDPGGMSATVGQLWPEEFAGYVALPP